MQNLKRNSLLKIPICSTLGKSGRIEKLLTPQFFLNKYKRKHYTVVKHGQEVPKLTKFGIVMHLGHPDPIRQQSLRILKIQDGGSRHLEKSKNSDISKTS